MKNTMISNKELEALQEIYKGVDHFFEAHKKIDMESIIRASEEERVHILLYMKMTRDFVEAIGSLRSLVEMDKEEFIKTVTDDGKTTLKEVKDKLMTNMLMDIIMK